MSQSLAALIGDALTTIAQERFDAFGEAWAAAVRQAAPVRSGKLRASVHWERKNL